MKSLLDVRLPGLIWFSFLFVWFFCCTFWEGFLFYLPTIYLLLNFSFLQFFLIPRNQVLSCHQFSSVQSLSRVRLFATPWIAARQASLSITNSQSWLRLRSMELVMPSSHLILCRPLLLLPPIPPSIRIFSNESTLEVAKVLEFQL